MICGPHIIQAHLLEHDSGDGGEILNVDFTVSIDIHMLHLLPIRTLFGFTVMGGYDAQIADSDFTVPIVIARLLEPYYPQHFLLQIGRAYHTVPGSLDLCLLPHHAI